MMYFTAGPAIGCKTVRRRTASIDVNETDNEVRISADLPGVSESDVDVSLVDDILTIRAEKKLEKKDEKGELSLGGAFLRHIPARAATALRG
jgi:HSP20 family molecular chaperone IbpA